MDDYLERKRAQISDAVAAMYLFTASEVKDLPAEERELQAGNASDVVAARADRLLYPSNKPRPVREPSALSALAWGVALLAYTPGGVDFFDKHYCIEPHAGCPGGQNGTPCKPADESTAQA